MNRRRLDLMGSALAAAMCGWPVFPCRPGDKRPAVDDWPNRATTDFGRIARYWKDHPATNIGVACGRAGLVVIDLDANKGEMPAPWDAEPGVRDGLDVWAVLRERHDPTFPQWLATNTVATPSGGQHWYFAGTGHRNTAGMAGPMVDTRADGGYVLAAGSVVNGRPYETLDDADPVPLPGWVARLLTKPEPPPRPAWFGFERAGTIAVALEGLVRTVLEAPQGQRNSTLNWAAYRAGEYASAGHLDETEAAEALYAAGLASGLTDRETRATIASGLRSSYDGR